LDEEYPCPVLPRTDCYPGEEFLELQHSEQLALPSLQELEHLGLLVQPVPQMQVQPVPPELAPQVLPEPPPSERPERQVPVLQEQLVLQQLARP
jgi:hypothetical protein